MMYLKESYLFLLFEDYSKGPVICFFKRYMTYVLFISVYFGQTTDSPLIVINTLKYILIKILSFEYKKYIK